MPVPCPDTPLRHQPHLRTRNRPSADDRRRPLGPSRPVAVSTTSLDQYYGNDSDEATTGKDTAPASRCTKPKRRSWPRCPNRPEGVVVNRHTGVVVTPQCRRLRCPSCIVPRAIGVGQALALARPNLWITLTEIGATWPEVQQGMKMFKQRLCRMCVSGAFAYNVEPSDNGRTGHAHLWWRGEEVARTTIQIAAESGHFGSYAEVGTAFPASVAYARPTIEYGLKAILRDRPEQPSTLWPSALDYLERNGGRLVHSTRDFWLDAHGNRTTLTEATRAAHRTDAGAWLYLGAA